ncbi:MAG: transcription termination/antitermination protein NusG, partial [Clostridia bacterium]|nr:transcription termination/antitermination protein NusG [Clostridia bacterium]
MADDARWYVIHTYSGYENKVADSIQKIVENRSMQDYILDVKIPTEIVTEIREDKTTREVERKIFPGYVLVKLAVFYDDDGQPKMTDDTWYVIRNTRGCTGFVGPESKPVPLTEEEVL